MATVLLRALVLVLLSAGPALAQHESEGSEAWQTKKCRIYAEAWQHERTRLKAGKTLSPDFIASNDSFIAGGCIEKVAVCPRSPADFDMANILTIRAMNAGMASTFLPFACPKSAGDGK